MKTEDIKITNKEDLYEQIRIMMEKVKTDINPTLKDKVIFNSIKTYLGENQIFLEDYTYDFLDNALPVLEIWCAKIIRPVHTIYDEKIGTIHAGNIIGENPPAFECFKAIIENNKMARDGLLVTERDGKYVIREYILCANDYYANENERVFNTNDNNSLVQKIKNVASKITQSPIQNGFAVLSSTDFNKLKELHKIDNFASINTLIQLENMKKKLKQYQESELEIKK